MARERKTNGPVISIRTGADIIALIEAFRRSQMALPTQTEAIRVLVRLGFETWMEREAKTPAPRRS